MSWSAQDSDFTEEALEPSEVEMAVDPYVVVIKNIPLNMKQDNFLDFIVRGLLFLIRFDSNVAYMIIITGSFGDGAAVRPQLLL